MVGKQFVNPLTQSIAFLDVDDLLAKFREIVREEMMTASQNEKIEKFYTIKETCERLRISESTFHRWRKNGTLRVVTNGSVVRIPEEEIQRMVLNAKM